MESSRAAQAGGGQGKVPPSWEERASGVRGGRKWGPRAPPRGRGRGWGGDAPWPPHPILSSPLLSSPLPRTPLLRQRLPGRLPECWRWGQQDAGGSGGGRPGGSAARLAGAGGARAAWSASTPVPASPCSPGSASGALPWPGGSGPPRAAPGRPGRSPDRGSLGAEGSQVSAAVCACASRGPCARRRSRSPNFERSPSGDLEPPDVLGRRKQTCPGRGNWGCRLDRV